MVFDLRVLVNCSKTGSSFPELFLFQKCSSHPFSLAVFVMENAVGGPHILERMLKTKLQYKVYQ